MVLLWWLALLSQLTATMGTNVFWFNKHRYPIRDRTPWFTMMGYLPLTYFNIWQLFEGERSPEEPCSKWFPVIMFIVLPAMVIGITLRAWILLFRFEITADLLQLKATTAAARVNDALNNHNNTPTSPLGTGSVDGPSSPAAGASTPLSPPRLTHQFTSRIIHHKLSWYSQHSKMMKWRWILPRIYVPMGILGFTAYGVTVAHYDVPCHSDNPPWIELPAYWTFCFGAVSCVFIVRIAKKLGHHGHDSLGLKSELIMILIITILASIASFIIFYAIGGWDAWIVMMLICVFLLWFTLFVYPLLLVYKHARDQRLLADEVEHASSLADLLNIPLCQQAFSDFLAKEFCAELLVFYLRCISFRRLTLPAQPPQGHSRIKTLPSTKSMGPLRLLQSSPSTATLLSSSTTPQATSVMLAISAALREAYVMHRTFIVAGSLYEMNLSDATRRHITTQLQALTAAAAAAQREHHHHQHTLTTMPSSRTLTTAMPAPQTSPATSPSDTQNNISSPPHPAVGVGHHAHYTNGMNSASDRFLFDSIISIYDSASAEVLHLMEMNSWQRFRSSTEYKSMIHNLQNDGTLDNDNRIIAAAQESALATDNMESNIVSPMVSPAVVAANAAAAAAASRSRPASAAAAAVTTRPSSAAATTGRHVAPQPTRMRLHSIHIVSSPVSPPMSIAPSHVHLSQSHSPLSQHPSQLSNATTPTPTSPNSTTDTCQLLPNVPVAQTLQAKPNH